MKVGFIWNVCMYQTNTGKFMAFPDAGNIQETYSKILMYQGKICIAYMICYVQISCTVIGLFVTGVQWHI